MARPEKVAVVEEIRTKLADADAALLTEYRGLTVPELAALRASLRGSGTEYKVFKNTLVRRAVADAGLDDVASMFEGPVAIVFVRGDAASAAKALREFGRTNPSLVVKGGLLGERLLGPVEIDALADLPSRDVLLATVAAPSRHRSPRRQVCSRRSPGICVRAASADRPARRCARGGRRGRRARGRRATNPTRPNQNPNPAARRAVAESTNQRHRVAESELPLTSRVRRVNDPSKAQENQPWQP